MKWFSIKQTIQIFKGFEAGLTEEQVKSYADIDVPHILMTKAIALYKLGLNADEVSAFIKRKLKELTNTSH